MKKTREIFQNKYLQWIFITALIVYQAIRLIAFVNVYGGIENDAGWFLGVARSLAETNSFTTMVSTMPDPTTLTGLDINREFFQVQNEEGRVYFFIEGTVGPTQIMPDAIIIKLFGNGFWQFRAGSLLFYLLFLILASWLLFSTGGFAAALLFQIILFFYPHLSVSLGYEALGEVPMVTCILLSFFLFAQAASSEENRNRYFFISGVVAGLAIMSKIIALLSLTSLGILWVVLYLQKKATLREGLIVVSGVVVGPLIWEVVQLITIAHLFGFDIYVQHAQQRFNFFVSGSGIDQHTPGNTEFFWYKLSLISEISHPNRVLSYVNLAVVVVSGPLMIWYFRSNRLHQNLIILLWGGWLVHTLWFIGRAENGWVRRYWVALILAVLLLSLLWGTLLRRVKMPPIGLNLLAALALTLLFITNFSSQRHAATFFMTDSLVDYWYQKHLAAARTKLPSTIVPRSDQEDALAVLEQLPTSARIFYPENYKSAEMAALSGRVFYPVERRKLMPEGQNDILLLGSSVISPWRKPAEGPITQAGQQAFLEEIVRRIEQQCPSIILKNNNYIICQLD